MPHSPSSCDFCLSTAIETARSESLDAALSTFPELQDHQDLLARLLDAMAAADGIEAALAEQNKAVDQLSQSLQLALSA